MAFVLFCFFVVVVFYFQFLLIATTLINFFAGTKQCMRETKAELYLILVHLTLQ